MLVPHGLDPRYVVLELTEREVAEGIETPAQLDIVRSLGIGAGHGYLLGRPTDRPSTEPLDLEDLSRSTDWLIDRLRVMPA